MVKEKKTNEKIIMQCHKHWINFAKSIVVAIILFYLAIVFAVGKVLSVTAVIVLIAIIVIARAYIMYKTDYIELTETQIVEHRGFIRSKSKAAPLSKIQNVAYSNGLFGKIFHYHSITIDNAGSDHAEYVWKNMANAQEFVKAVQERL